jgi:hypothetical protein
MTPDDLAEWDAAYVLGALSPEERREYERFLAANPTRAVELTELAGLPGILNALTREEALALIEGADVDDSAGERPLDLMPSLARAAARRQRRSRRTFVAATVASAAAVLIAGGIVGATVFPRQSSPPSSTTAALQPMQPTPRGGITASLAVTEKRWGTRLDWTCEYTKDWSRNVHSYDMMVTTDDGVSTAVASWSPAGDEATGLAASTTIPTSQIRTVDIRVAGTTEPLAITTMP